MAFIESGKTFDKDENYEKMKTRMGNMDYKQYPLRIPVNLHKKLKVKLAKEGKSLKSILLEMLEEYLNTGNKEIKK
jgi:predicted HicB family RNase H-like nuclease